MKTPPNPTHANPPRRHLLGALAGAVTALAGLKLGSRKPSAPVSVPLAGNAGVETDPTASRPTRLVVKPAPNSVKRHG